MPRFGDLAHCVCNKDTIDRSRHCQCNKSTDLVDNTLSFQIIESTLREGEQFANAYFTTETKIEIAKALDDFGVEYIELTSPCASEQSRRDCEILCNIGLKNAKILTHVRCHLDDAKLAVSTGVDGVNVVMGTSDHLMQYSHGKGIKEIQKSAIEVIQYVKSQGKEIRFSTEDSFRSDIADVLALYATAAKLKVNRVGIADTVGFATPRQTLDLVGAVRGAVDCDIETHFHNDTDCAVANTLCALEAGATHIDTSVLGIGERNGITPLGGLVARIVALPGGREYLKSKYRLEKLKELEKRVADAVSVSVPFNNPITGGFAFTHKAGIHAKAVLTNPSTYEIISPSDFGLDREVLFASRLTGWNAISHRASELGFSMSVPHIKSLTAQIKRVADRRPLKADEVDEIIRDSSLHIDAAQ